MDEQLERRVIELIATDRIDIPISSISGKLKRKKPKLAKAIQLPKKSYEGERVYAIIKTEDIMKARGIKEGIDLFEEKFPRYGRILRGLIEEKRTERETHLYFGMNEGRRLTTDDYVAVMTDLGFSEQTAESMYQELMSVSRRLSRKRDEERRILIYSTL